MLKIQAAVVSNRKNDVLLNLAVSLSLSGFCLFKVLRLLHNVKQTLHLISS